MTFDPPRIESAPPMLLAGLRRHHTMASASTSLAEQWREFRSSPGAEANGSPAYGAICGSTGDRFEYLTGVEVDSFDGLPSDFGRMRIPAQRYAVFTYAGGIAAVGALWQHIWSEWLPRAPFEDAETPPFERYAPDFDPLAGRGRFEIWFPIRDRS